MTDNHRNSAGSSPSLYNMFYGGGIHWPKDSIPLELFMVIVSYLDRNDMKAMRLVCHEFDSKIIPTLYYTSVVPFGPNIYTPSESLQTPNSGGLDMFRSLGPSVHRFALTLEVDQHSLVYLPYKSAKKLIITNGGVCLWPHLPPTPFHELERMHRDARNPFSITQAFNQLSNVRSMGFSFDAGRGHLCKGHLVHGERHTWPRQAVFPPHPKRPRFSVATGTDPDAMAARLRPMVNPAGVDLDRSFFRRFLHNLDNVRESMLTTTFHNHMIAEIMAEEAGCQKSQVDKVVSELLATERCTIDNLDVWFPFGFPIRRGNSQSLEIALRRWAHFRPNVTPSTDVSSLVALSRPQREFIFEIYGMQCLLLSSYMATMVYNSRHGKFKHLTTLNIAKISSSLVHIICNIKVWESLSCLTNVSLGVIPDWRDQLSTPNGDIRDLEISPFNAVRGAYDLLHNHIGRQPGIKSLHFEWIGGGEFSLGYLLRNQFILPAPFLGNASSITAVDVAILKPESLLALPHVKHLSLQNCWVSPHIFIQAVRRMALASLEHLDLESVSLSGPPTTAKQTLSQEVVQLDDESGPEDDHGVGWEEDDTDEDEDDNRPSELLPQDTSDGPGEITLDGPVGEELPGLYTQHGEPIVPRLSTWPGILEHFSPGRRVRPWRIDPADIAAKHKLELWGEVLRRSSLCIPSPWDLATDESKYKIRKVSLKSCGYVGIDASHLKTCSLFRGATWDASIETIELRNAINRLFDSHKKTLFGVIIPFLRPEEAKVLVDSFGMTIGWDGVYGTDLALCAKADGVFLPGLSRISGTLERGQRF